MANHNIMFPLRRETNRANILTAAKDELDNLLLVSKDCGSPDELLESIEHAMVTGPKFFPAPATYIQ